MVGCYSERTVHFAPQCKMFAIIFYFTLLSVSLLFLATGRKSIHHYLKLYFRIPHTNLFRNNEVNWRLYKSRFQYCREIYNTLAPHKYGVFFHVLTPKIMFRDPDMIKCILMNDSENFPSRENLFFLPNDTLTHSVMNLDGNEWKQVRAFLAPGFSSSKLKCTFDLILECAQNLENVLVAECEGSKSVDMKILISRYLIDATCSVTLGLNPNSVADRDSIFYKISKKFRTRGFGEKMKYLLFASPVSKMIKRYSNIHFYDPEVTDFFRGVLQESIRVRKSNPTVRNDFLQMFITAMDKENENVEKPVKWTLDMILAQCIGFMNPSFFTTSNAVNFAFHEIACNTSVQEKLHREIDDALIASDGKISYDVIQNMTYLDQIVQEVTRKHSPVPLITRKCKNTCVLSVGNVEIKEGTIIAVPISGLHHDPQHYPNPEVFDPERFTAEAKSSRHPFTFLPYGSGIRHCLGQRLAELITKAAVVTVMRDFSVSILPECALTLLSNTIGTEPVKNELQFSKR